MIIGLLGASGFFSWLYFNYSDYVLYNLLIYVLFIFLLASSIITFISRSQIAKIKTEKEDLRTAIGKAALKAENEQKRADDVKKALDNAEREADELAKSKKELQDDLGSAIEEKHQLAKRLNGLYSEFEILKGTHEQEEQMKLKKEFAKMSEYAQERGLEGKIIANVRGPFEAQVYKIEELYGDLKTKR
ncbi:Uncharacterised protein [uncultured archaeon]|nr:Uncharacterised protein [uncultured archaeon]